MYVKGCFGFWFPAAGYRTLDGGGLDGSPFFGDYWSASPYSGEATTAGILGLNSSGEVTPHNGGSRSYGFSVRCVSEVASKK